MHASHVPNELTGSARCIKFISYYPPFFFSNTAYHISTYGTYTHGHALTEITSWDQILLCQAGLGLNSNCMTNFSCGMMDLAWAWLVRQQIMLKRQIKPSEVVY